MDSRLLFTPLLFPQFSVLKIIPDPIEFGPPGKINICVFRTD